MPATKPNTSLFDKSFHKKNELSYQLYIELSLNGLQQTILDVTTKTFIGIEEYIFTDVFNEHDLVPVLEEIINTNPLYQLNFKNISLAYNNNRATLIPNAIFEANKLAEYHKFNFSVVAQDDYFSDQLINLSAANIYSLPKSIIAPFERLSTINIKHVSSPFIEAALIDSKANNTLSSVTVNVLKSSLQVAIIKNQKLALYNSFSYQTSEDFLYFLLFVLDQQNINNEEAIITVYGAIDKNGELYSALHQYIQTIHFGERTKNLKFSYILEDVPTHKYHTLFNQFLCE